MAIRERLLTAPLVLASFVLSNGWKVVEFLTGVEGIKGSPTLGPLATAVASRLPDLPAWVVVFAWVYLFVWLGFGRVQRSKADHAPRLVLSSAENQDEIAPSTDLVVKNVGERSAFTVRMSVLEIGKYELRPHGIARLPPGDSAPLNCDVMGGAHPEWKRPLGDEIVATVDTVPLNLKTAQPAEFVASLRLTYFDQDGERFEDYFTVRIYSPLKRIRPPEKFWPTPFQALRTWTGAKHRILET